MSPPTSASDGQQDRIQGSAALTTEITVLCSYCKEPTTVPFYCGAVMPMPESDEGVRVHIGAVKGGDHRCRSDRRKSERAWWLRSHPEAESA